MKKFLSVLLSTLMIFICMSTNAFALGIPSIEYDGNTWHWGIHNDVVSVGDNIRGICNTSPGKVYLDKIEEPRDGVGSIDGAGTFVEVVKIDGDKLYVCSNHDITNPTDGYCVTCGRDNTGNLSAPTLTMTVTGTSGNVTYSGGTLINGETISGLSQLRIINSNSSDGDMYYRLSAYGVASNENAFLGDANDESLDSTKSYRISWINNGLLISDALSGMPTHFTLVDSPLDTITFDSDVDYANAALFASNQTYTKQANFIIFGTKTESGTTYYKFFEIDIDNGRYWISAVDQMSSDNMETAIETYNNIYDFYVIGTVSSDTPPQNDEGNNENDNSNYTKVVTCEEAFGAGWYWDDAKGCQFKAPRTDVK